MVPTPARSPAETGEVHTQCRDNSSRWQAAAKNPPADATAAELVRAVIALTVLELRQEKKGWQSLAQQTRELRDVVARRARRALEAAGCELREDPVANAINHGENRYRQTVLSQGPLPGYPVIERTAPSADGGHHV